MSDRLVYEVRRGSCDPRHKAPAHRGRTFSVGIGETGSRTAAIYRVKGSVSRPEEVDRLAARLVAWLNDPRRLGAFKSPCEVPYSNDGYARIQLTAAGKKAGWLRP